MYVSTTTNNIQTIINQIAEEHKKNFIAMQTLEIDGLVFILKNLLREKHYLQF